MDSPKRPTELAHRIFWEGFIAAGGKRISRTVCETLDGLALRYDKPTLESDNGALLLRHRRHGALWDIDPKPWTLRCGTVLRSDTPVFELDLSSAVAEEILARNANVLREGAYAFRSLVPKLAGRSEAAIVARTTLLMHQLLKHFGFEQRAMRRTAHWYGDTFLRHMYLLSFNHEGARRAVECPMTPLVESAISLKALLNRYAK